MQEWMGNENIGRSPKKELKRNARNQKHCNRNKSASDRLINRLDIAKERVSELFISRNLQN